MSKKRSESKPTEALKLARLSDVYPIFYKEIDPEMAAEEAVKRVNKAIREMKQDLKPQQHAV